jgi:uncharacterized protein (DUF2147 family)
VNCCPSFFILKESFMRSLLALVFLLIAGSAGHTQSFSFNVGGQPIHVDVRGYCAECISVVVPGYVQYGRPRSYDYDVPYAERRSHRPPRAAQTQKRKPQVAMLRDPSPTPASESRNAAPVREAPAAAPAVATSAPEVVAPLAPPSAAAPAAEPSPPPPAAQAATPPAAEPVPDKKPTVIAALPPAKQEAEQRPKPALAMPLGVWSSAEGQMRVEQCGKNLCSYAVGGRHAGKMILRNMRQTSDNRWAGQVTDVRSGQTYSAHMSMRGPNALNIQGCALGGLVCGGRTMSRVH